MKRPFWKQDWFWFVLLPELFVGALFALVFAVWAVDGLRL